MDQDEPIVGSIPKSIIPRSIQPGDYVAGAETGIDFQINIPNGNWDQFAMPDNADYQVAIYFDNLGCSNYSCGHSLEMQLNRLMALGIFTPEEIAELTAHKFIVNGKFNRLAKRYNAIISGTNGGQIPNHFLGNYFYKPWDSARHDGMVPDSLCPFPRLQRTPIFSVKDYYNPAVTQTPEVLAAAAVWKKIFTVKYEVVPPTIAMLKKHMTQAPICIDTGTCSPWSDGLVPICSDTQGHGTALYGSVDGRELHIEDSYRPSLKRLAWGYPVHYAIKGVLYPSRQLAEIGTPPMPATEFDQEAHYGQTSDYIVHIQNKLKILKFFPTNVNSTGYYGTITAGAVLKFQIAKKVADLTNLQAQAGHFVDQPTLTALNNS